MDVSLYQAAAAMNATARWQDLIAENLSAAFGQRIALEAIDGRYFARRIRARAAHRRSE